MRRLRRIIAAGEEGRLDGVTLEWLSAALERPLTKSAVRRLIMAGAVRVDGRPARRPGLVLPAGSRIEADIDIARLAPRHESTQPARAIRVLYEDEALIAVAKPPGLPMHAGADPSRPDLFTLVRRQLATRPGAAPGVPYLGLHHRLDRDTSGVVLFTKIESANAGLAAQFAARAVEKVYHAITVRPAVVPARPWDVEDELGQVGTGRTSRRQRVASGGQPARTSFAILEQFPHALLVEARPHTGRKHQVRAHVSGGGMPIVGDQRYGGPRRVAGLIVARPLLHACRLAFAHPLTGAPVEISCEYGEEFRGVLERLRHERFGRVRRLDTVRPTR